MSNSKNSSVLRIKATGTRLELLSDEEHLTSGSVNTVECEFTTDNSWEDLTLSAAFGSDPDALNAVLLDSEKHCIINSAALAVLGNLYIGLYGTANTNENEIIKRSELIKIHIFKGAEGNTSAIDDTSSSGYAEIIQRLDSFSYTALKDTPTINGHALSGEHTLVDLGLAHESFSAGGISGCLDGMIGSLYDNKQPKRIVKGTSKTFTLNEFCKFFEISNEKGLTYRAVTSGGDTYQYLWLAVPEAVIRQQLYDSAYDAAQGYGWRVVMGADSSPSAVNKLNSAVTLNSNLVEFDFSNATLEEKEAAVNNFISVFDSGDAATEWLGKFATGYMPCDTFDAFNILICAKSATLAEAMESVSITFPLFLEPASTTVEASFADKVNNNPYELLQSGSITTAVHYIDFNNLLTEDCYLVLKGYKTDKTCFLMAYTEYALGNVIAQTYTQYTGNCIASAVKTNGAGLRLDISSARADGTGMGRDTKLYFTTDSIKELSLSLSDSSANFTNGSYELWGRKKQ